MIRTLLENPLPIALIGGMSLAILVGGLAKTGRVVLLWAILAVVLMTGGALLLERYVVTPAEEVELTLHQIARDIEANDVPRMLQHISSAAPDLYREANAILSSVEVQEARINRNLKVELSAGPNPATATASFNGIVVASEKRGIVERQRGAWFFVVNFRREGDAWRVASYERRDLREGMRQRD